MILTIDIGNTTTKFGVFENGTIIKRHLIPTIRSKTADEIFESLGNELNFNFTGAIVSSVVPELNLPTKELIENNLNSSVFFVENDFDFGFDIRYDTPENVGIDRLIAAYAAVQKYGKPCIICDFGTATTIDVVNKRNEYLGGIITPGMNLLADVLYQRTSKLPKIELRKPPKVIGDSTITAMQSGVYYGYIGLVDGIIKQMSAELGAKPKVIATGGLVKIIAETSKAIKVVDEDLILEGLYLIFTKLAEK